MNILLLTYQGDISGATNSIYYLARGLAQRGHTVVVGCRSNSLLWSMLESASGVIRVAMQFASKFDRRCMAHIQQIVQQYNIQIINAQSSRDRYLSIFACWRYQLAVKIVHTRRQKAESAGGRLQTWFYVGNTDAIVTVSEQLKKDFVQRGFPAHHLHVIYNGMDSSRFATPIPPATIEQLRQTYHLSATDLVVGCISRPKRQEQLIRALALLPPHIKLLLVGVPPQHYQALERQLQLPHTIVYAGLIPPAHILAYYALCNVQVLPSTMDGFGLVLLEAMGMGVPVVATRSQGIIDVVGANEERGLLFDDGNIAQLAQQIQTALYHSQRRTQLIEAGYKAAFDTFNIERTIDHYEAFFAQLCT